LGYDATRGLRHGTLATADRNGWRLLHLERNLHLAPEHPLNHVLHQLPVLAVLAAYIYATLHFLITPTVLVWLYRRHPDRYRQARTWIATLTLGALVGFWLYPVTPPRMLPGAGIRDTLADVHQWGWWQGESSAPRGLGGLANEFAAMPSLHVAWAVWVGVLVALHAQRRIVRSLALAYPLVIALVVIATGNHYLADVIAGAVLAAVTGLLTTRLYQGGTFIGLPGTSRARSAAAAARPGFSPEATPASSLDSPVVELTMVPGQLRCSGSVSRGISQTTQPP
jgi:membrane-associated phospholipid phosphatase